MKQVFAFAALICLAIPVHALDAAPKVVSLSPADGEVEVPAGETTELVVVFDRPMNTSAFSFCGGGPSFPKTPEGEQPFWKNSTTCVFPVALEAGHNYSLSLNAAAFKNFCDREGVALVPQIWSFSTLPFELPDPKKQRKRNKAAWGELKMHIDKSYSYRDLRATNWKQVFKEHTEAINNSRTTPGWAAAVANMLAVTQDLHLHLSHGGHVFPVGRRAVDPLYRSQLLTQYIEQLTGIGRRAAHGRTSDGIGYLAIASWTKELDIAGVERALEEMQDAKALIIDVRANSGGDELLAQRIAQWFVEGKKTYAKNRYRTGKGKRGFGPILAREIKGNRNEKRYRGQVLLLTSRYVMSSCEAFVLMMRQGEHCTVVGQPTFGSSGNPKPFELSNGVTLSLPSWQAMRPDGSVFEGEGIAPDVFVEVDPTVLDRKDPILERALEILRD